MLVSIHQPQYMPWLGFLDKIRSADVFVLLDDVQFKKNEWQNRNRILTPQGPQWLTVPVLHQFGEKISEVRINNKTNWRRNHLRSIEMNYKKAPFFNQYFGHFEEILSREWEFLSDLNICVIEKLMAVIGIQTRLELSSNYASSNDPNQRLIDLCRAFDGTQYLAGKDGPAYMDMEQFKQHGIEVMLQAYNPLDYPQLWRAKNNEDFISHLSVIDLLLNCGPQALKIIESGSEIVRGGKA